MAETTTLTASTYPELRRAVEGAMLRGQRAVERAKLQTYHETGRIISAHLLQHHDRADYGRQIILQLAADLRVSDRVLYQCLQFARIYPILHARAEFTWAHYRVLIQVPDAAQRRTLTAQAIKAGWTSRQLEERVRALSGESAPTPPAIADASVPLLVPKRGTPGICQVVTMGDTLVADLGFASYWALPADSGVAEKTFVQTDHTDGVTPAPAATKTDLFTYAAEILQVVDGDTLWIKIQLRPRLWVKHKLRLRDLDCPELAAPEGKAAKRFVEALVAKARSVVICTTKPDKYDRYLADVFLRLSGEQGAGSLEQELFLNNALLSAGHAVPKKAWAFSDWGE